MFSNECATIHRLYQRLQTSAGPLILIFIGLTILHLLFRKYVTDVGTFWCDTDLAAVVIIIGIIDLFEGLLDENRSLNGKLTEKIKIIQGKNVSLNESKTMAQDFRNRLNEQVNQKLFFQCENEAVTTFYSTPATAALSSNGGNKLLDEIQQLRNQLLNKDVIIQQNDEASHKREKDLSVENHELREQISIKEMEIFKLNDTKEQLSKEAQNLRQHLEASYAKNQQLCQQVIIKEKEISQLKEKHKKEIYQLKEKHKNEIEHLTKEVQKMRKQLSSKDVIIDETNEKSRKLENPVQKTNTLPYQNKALQTPSKQQPSNPSTPRRQILVKSNDICKTSQQQKKEEKGSRQVKKLPLSNITNTITSSRERSIPPQRNFAEETVTEMDTVPRNNVTFVLPRNNQSSTPRRRILVNSNDIRKTSQQQKKEEKGLELLKPQTLPFSNVTNTITSSSERSIALPQPHHNFVEDDDDLPPPPSSALLHQINSSSYFSASTPTLFKMPVISSSSEQLNKGTPPPPIAPKPKTFTSPAPPPLPQQFATFTKSFPATPSSSNISILTKTPQSQQRSLNPSILAEIQSSPKLRNLKEAEKERKKKESKNVKLNYTPDLKTLLSLRADKVNSAITDDEKENDSDGEWEK